MITYDTNKSGSSIIRRGNINFKCNYGSFEGMPHAELINIDSVVMAIKTERKFFEGYTKQYVEKSKLSG